jgi:hypothetical protein
MRTSRSRTRLRVFLVTLLVAAALALAGASTLNANCYPLDPFLQCVSTCDTFWVWCVNGRINEWCYAQSPGDVCAYGTGHPCCSWIAGL